MENIRNFSPAEQKAWKEVSKEMFKELEKNPKVNLSTNLARSIKRMIQKPDWITEPFKTLKTTLIDAAKGSFYHIGAGCSFPLHNPEFLPKPYTIIRLTALHTDIIGHYLLQKAVNQ